MVFLLSFLSKCLNFGSWWEFCKLWKIVVLLFVELWKIMMIEEIVFVIGGVGFLGFKLCECLFVDGNYVLCVDNFFIGYIKNIEYLMFNICFEFFRYDICFLFYVEVSEIYNFVCLVLLVNY